MLKCGNYCNDSKRFIEYSNNIQDVKNIEDYNAGKEHKGLFDFDNMIAVMIGNKKLNPVVLSYLLEVLNQASN